MTANQLTADEQLLKESLLRVLDDGCTCDPEFERHPWEMDADVDRDCQNGSGESVTEDMANAQRLRFAEAVIAQWRRFKFDDAEEQRLQRVMAETDHLDVGVRR